MAKVGGSSRWKRELEKKYEDWLIVKKEVLESELEERDLHCYAYLVGQDLAIDLQ